MSQPQPNASAQSGGPAGAVHAASANPGRHPVGRSMAGIGRHYPTVHARNAPAPDHPPGHRTARSFGGTRAARAAVACRGRADQSGLRGRLVTERCRMPLRGRRHQRGAKPVAARTGDHPGLGRMRRHFRPSTEIQGVLGLRGRLRPAVHPRPGVCRGETRRPMGRQGHRGRLIGTQARIQGLTGDNTSLMDLGRRVERLTRRFGRIALRRGEQIARQQYSRL